jgi:hypothetical protein
MDQYVSRETSLPDAEFAENDVQDFFHVHRAGDLPESPHSQPNIFPKEFVRRGRFRSTNAGICDRQKLAVSRTGQRGTISI